MNLAGPLVQTVSDLQLGRKPDASVSPSYSQYYPDLSKDWSRDLQRWNHDLLALKSSQDPLLDLFAGVPFRRWVESGLLGLPRVTGRAYRNFRASLTQRAVLNRIVDKPHFELRPIGPPPIPIAGVLLARKAGVGDIGPVKRDRILVPQNLSEEGTYIELLGAVEHKPQEWKLVRVRLDVYKAEDLRDYVARKDLRDYVAPKDERAEDDDGSSDEDCTEIMQVGPDGEWFQRCETDRCSGPCQLQHDFDDVDRFACVCS